MPRQARERLCASGSTASPPLHPSRLFLKPAATRAGRGGSAPPGCGAPGGPGCSRLPEEPTWERSRSSETSYEAPENIPMEGPLQTVLHVCHENGQWMSRLPEKLWDIPLYNLALPGSHDTMTYCLDRSSAVLTVTEQLEAGVRYLDFRIAHKANDPSMNLYFVHMVYTTVTVQAILWEILRWLETHPQEVVIIACRNFDGLTKRLHNHLVACIKEIFQCKLCPRNVVPTLRTLWHLGHQVIVSYEEDVELEKHCELWPPIPYWWGNKTSTRALIRYLERMKRMGRPGKFFVAGINLTENLRYILVHPFGSLKKMTLQSLPCLKIWIKQQYPGPKKKCINIIAGDFIGNNDFVKDVIELNTKINTSLHCQSELEQIAFNSQLPNL
ncbi:PI-PLC X domain-containing protein 1 isoform X2 [Prinia subflava]|uniref:PI-PLC X domain-containing protein 1 isoform X2 n=1 Tax=Prinia subflava TaxID=208062 RepID=UPI002FE3AA44